jgi:DNA-binding HxlR family transcriptional regulator
VTRHREWLPNELCSVAGALEIMGERWTIMVLRESFLGTRRFDDFQRNIGCARNILSDRLQKLVANDILERRRYQERPPRFEYRLTQKGIDLWPAIIALMQWGDRHLANERGPAITLEHKTCGHESSPQLVCSHCGEKVTAREFRAHPGPGSVPATATA